MPTRRALPRLSLVAVLLVALTACGSESDEDAAVDALAADLHANESFDDGDISAQDATCTAEQVVDTLGADRVEEVGYTSSEEDADLDALSDDELGTVARSLADCVDGIEDVLVRAAKSGLIDGSGTGLQDEGEAECVAHSLVDGLGVERLLIVDLTGDGAPFAEGSLTDREAEVIADGFVECVDTRAILVEQFEAEDLPSDVATCLATELPEDNLREFFAAEFSGREVDPESLLAPALGVCGLG